MFSASLLRRRPRRNRRSARRKERKKAAEKGGEAETHRERQTEAEQVLKKCEEKAQQTERPVSSTRMRRRKKQKKDDDVLMTLTVVFSTRRIDCSVYDASLFYIPVDCGSSFASEIADRASRRAVRAAWLIFFEYIWCSYLQDEGSFSAPLCIMVLSTSASTALSTAWS